MGELIQIFTGDYIDPKSVLSISSPKNAMGGVKFRIVFTHGEDEYFHRYIDGQVVPQDESFTEFTERHICAIKQKWDDMVEQINQARQ